LVAVTVKAVELPAFTDAGLAAMVTVGALDEPPDAPVTV